MKALYFDGTKAVYREDAPMPVREEGQSLIRILLADICSTDREILKGYRPDFRGIMGHEFVGEVVESPDPKLVGKIVVGELNEGCGECLYCRTGREKHCLSRKVIGMSKDGCFAEYMTLASHLIHVVPEGLAPEEAIFTEPLAAAPEITKQVQHSKPLRQMYAMSWAPDSSFDTRPCICLWHPHWIHKQRWRQQIGLLQKQNSDSLKPHEREGAHAASHQTQIQR